MTLAEKILSLRTERGMSQDDLAEKLEVSRQSVSKWETAQSTPDLDKIIKLADLFGVSVDQLVRDGERPRPPEPPEAKVIYVEREKQGLTPIQTLGVVVEVTGVGLSLVGLMGAPVLILPGAALVVLGLPLLLAKKHPYLITGWLAAALSLLVLNPYTSMSPWGLLGGLQRLYLFVTTPELQYRSTLFAIFVGISRGLLVLVLLFFTWRAWKKRGLPEKDG